MPNHSSSSAFNRLQTFCNAADNSTKTFTSKKDIQEIRRDHAQHLYSSCLKAKVIYFHFDELTSTPEHEETIRYLDEATQLYSDLLDEQTRDAIISGIRQSAEDTSVTKNIKAKQQKLLEMVAGFVSCRHTPRAKKPSSIEEIAKKSSWSFNECSLYLRIWERSSIFSDRLELLCGISQQEYKRPITPKEIHPPKASHLEAVSQGSSPPFARATPPGSIRSRPKHSTLTSPLVEHQKATIENLKTELEDTQRNLENLSKQYQLLKQRLEENSKLATSIDALQEQIIQLEEDRKQLTQNCTTLSKRLDSKTQELKQSAQQVAQGQKAKEVLEKLQASFKETQGKLADSQHQNAELLEEREAVLTQLEEANGLQGSDISTALTTLIQKTRTQQNQIDDLTQALIQHTQTVNEPLHKQTYSISERKRNLEVKKATLEQELLEYRMQWQGLSENRTTSPTTHMEQHLLLQDVIQRKERELDGINADLNNMRHGTDSGYHSLEVSPDETTSDHEYFPKTSTFTSSLETLNRIKKTSQFLLANLYCLPLPIAQMKYDMILKLYEACRQEAQFSHKLQKECKNILDAVKKQLPDGSLVAKNKPYISTQWSQSSSRKSTHMQKAYKPYEFSTKAVDVLFNAKTHSTLQVSSDASTIIFTASVGKKALQKSTMDSKVSEHIKANAQVVIAYLAANPGCTVRIEDNDPVTAQKFYNVLKAHQNMLPSIDCNILSPNISDNETVKVVQKDIYGPLMDVSEQKTVETLHPNLADELDDFSDASSEISFTSSNSGGF